MQGVLVVAVHVVELSVEDQQVQLVARRNLADDLIHELEALLSGRFPAEPPDQLVLPVDDVEKNPLAVGASALSADVWAEKRAVEDGSVVGERPRAAADVTPCEGMRVVVLHDALRRVPDVRDRCLCHDPALQAVFQIRAAPGADRLFFDRRAAAVKEREPPAVRVAHAVRVKFLQKVICLDRRGRADPE